jgi:Co/Zn/Cd efflux system component
MAAFALGVAAEVVTKLARGLTPDAGIMWGMAALALLANGSVCLVLWRRRADDINMRSAWLCSRNDVIANAGVMVAAAGVSVTASAWPDVSVGAAIAVLFGVSALGVVRQALARPRLA